MSNKHEVSAEQNQPGKQAEKLAEKQGQKNKSLAWKLFVLAAMFFCAFIYATWKRGH